MTTRWLPSLLAALWGLPCVAALCMGVARLLTAMGDASGGRALDYVALAAGLLWLLVLAAMVSLLAQERIRRDAGDEPGDEPGDRPPHSERLG